MKECIIDKHREDAPGTYINGKVPIDGIFTTWSVNIQKGGYTAFDDGVQGSALTIDVSGSISICPIYSVQTIHQSCNFQDDGRKVNTQQ